MKMRRFGNSFRRRFLKNESGQAAVMVMITATTMMALAAASIETGHVYYAYQKLVASTNASVMAGAAAMPNTTTANNLRDQIQFAIGSTERDLDADERYGHADFQVPEHCIDFAERAVPDFDRRVGRIQRTGGDSRPRRFPYGLGDWSA